MSRKKPFRPAEPVSEGEVRWRDMTGSQVSAYQTDKGMWAVHRKDAGMSGEYTWDSLLDHIGEKRWKTLRAIGQRGY
jgi:hypothetical protein